MEVTVQEASTQLTYLLQKVESGETITIRRGSTPIAIISRPVSSPGEKRIWGDLPGSYSEDFDTPLEDFEEYS